MLSKYLTVFLCYLIPFEQMFHLIGQEFDMSKKQRGLIIIYPRVGCRGKMGDLQCLPCLMGIAKNIRKNVAPIHK